MTPKVYAAEICGPNELESLYKGVISALCSVSYVWRLAAPTSKSAEQSDCVLTYNMILSAGAILQTKTTVDFFANRHSPDIVRNTKATREYYERMVAKVGDNYGDESILNFLKRNPKYNAEVFYSPSLYGHVTKGPHVVTHAVGRAAERFGLLAIGLGLPGAILSGADLVFNSSATACDEKIHRFYSADPNNNCRPRNIISAEVLNFLSMSTDEQNKALKENPRLCTIYLDLTNSLRKSKWNPQYATAKVDCLPGGALKSAITYDGLPDAQVELRGLNATIKHGHENYNVEYGKTETGKIFVKSVSGQSDLTNGGAVSKPYRFNFPPGEKELYNQKFQQVLGEVSRHTMVLERYNAFSGNCSAAGQNKGSVRTTR